MNAFRVENRMLTVALVTASLVLAAGCADKKATRAAGSEAGVSAAPTPAPTATERAPDSPSRIGEGVSEEAFKAMHQVPAGTSPKLAGQMIDLAGGKQYLSLPPDAKAPLPAVILIHEWWGLTDGIKLWADRLAAEGYAALAVDLYDGKIATTPDDAMKYMKAVDDSKSRSVLAAAYDFVGADPRIAASKRASIGWCFGGGWSLQASLMKPMDATVIYYGHVGSDAAALAPLKGPVLGIFANLDESIPPAHVDAFDAALGKAGVTHTVYRYDAKHAFANPSNPIYDEKSAADAWAKTQAFLRSTIGK